MDNIHEFARKYAGTFIKYRQPTTGKYFAASVIGTDENDKSLNLSVEDLGIVLLSYPSGLSFLDVSSPSAGYFNHRGNAIFLFKNPARQWRRGVCSDNHELYNPLKRLFKEGIYRPTFVASTITSVFNPQYVPIHEAWSKLKDDHRLVSIACSASLMLSKSPMTMRNDQPLVWYKTTPVGVICDQKIVVKDQMFEQEIIDELTKLGETNWIS